MAKAIPFEDKAMCKNILTSLKAGKIRKNSKKIIQSLLDVSTKITLIHQKAMVDITPEGKKIIVRNDC